MSTTPVIATEGVGKRFGGFRALSDVTVAFYSGRLTSIIGPNGAGKSTFFNVLSGAFPPSEGRVLFEGRDITGTPQHVFPHLGIAKSFQITNLFPQLTALENVRLAAQAMKSRFDIWTKRETLTELKEKAEDLLDRVGLSKRRNDLAANLAHGEQRSQDRCCACQRSGSFCSMTSHGMSPEEARASGPDSPLNEQCSVIVEHRMKSSWASPTASSCCTMASFWRRPTRFEITTKCAECT